ENLTNVPTLAADIDGDGTLDFMNAPFYSDTGQVNIFLGNGDGTFRSGPTFNDAWSASLADFNADGKTDLVSANGDGSVSIFLSNGDGTFQIPTVVPTGLIPVPPKATAIAADWNQDGTPDLLAFVPLSGFKLLLQNHDFAISSSNLSPSSVSAGSSSSATIAISPQGSPVGGTILTCAVSPSGPESPQCSLNPGSVMLSIGNSSTSILTITTTRSSMALAGPSLQGRQSPVSIAFLMPTMLLVTLRLVAGKR